LRICGGENPDHAIVGAAKLRVATVSAFLAISRISYEGHEMRPLFAAPF
jgi:hypothetical protein